MLHFLVVVDGEAYGLSHGFKLRFLASKGMLSVKTFAPIKILTFVAVISIVTKLWCVRLPPLVVILITIVQNLRLCSLFLDVFNVAVYLIADVCLKQPVSIAAIFVNRL